MYLLLHRALRRDTKGKSLPLIRINYFHSLPQRISFQVPTSVFSFPIWAKQPHLCGGSATCRPWLLQGPATSRGLSARGNGQGLALCKGVFHLVSQQELSQPITQTSGTTKQCIHFYSKEIAMFIWTCLLSLKKK